MSRRIDQGLMLGLGLACLSAAFGECSRRPTIVSAEAWQQAAQQLKPLIKPGDLLLLNNAGSSQGMEQLRAFGLQPRVALPEPRGRIRRLWLLGTRADVPAGLVPLARQHDTLFTLPKGLTLSLWARPQGEVLWSAKNELYSAKIRAKGASCTQAHKGGWRCAHLADWMHVAPTGLQVKNSHKSCLWAHPPAGDKPLIIRFDAIPSGELIFEHGLSDKAAASSNKHPVRVELAWRGGGAKLQAGNSDGWKKSRQQVAGFLEIKISARKDGQRHHCFKASIR
jgi:hypothetical protein